MNRFSLVIAAMALATGLAAQDRKPAAGAAALQGTWAVTSINGQTASEGAPAISLTITGDKYHQTTDGQITERGTIKVDASKKPMTVDLIIGEGADAGKTQLGVAEVSGETLRMNLDTPGAGQRPADFTIKDGAIMVVAKKQKG